MIPLSINNDNTARTSTAAMFVLCTPRNHAYLRVFCASPNVFGWISLFAPTSLLSRSMICSPMLCVCTVSHACMPWMMRKPFIHSHCVTLCVRSSFVCSSSLLIISTVVSSSFFSFHSFLFSFRSFAEYSRRRAGHVPWSSLLGHRCP